MTISPGAFTFLPLEKVIYGAGCVNQLPVEVERLGCRRAFIITGRSLATHTPVVSQVESLLGELHAGTYKGIQQHAPESGIRAAVEQAWVADADLLISLGGGSPIDATKAAAHWLMQGTDHLVRHIAIPTTLSAAEFSHRAGYTDETIRAKTGFADEHSTARVVILDPQLTAYTPMRLWLGSGLRSVDHAVETLYSPAKNPISDVLALDAISDLFDALPRCKAYPQDMDARLQAQLAAWKSFFAPATVSMGLSHRLGRSIGATYDVAHGETSCIMLPHVMRYKVRTDAANLASLTHRLGKADGLSDEDAARMAAEYVADLVWRLELPQRLRDVGVPSDAVEQIARAAVGDSPEYGAVVNLLEGAW